MSKEHNNTMVEFRKIDSYLAQHDIALHKFEEAMKLIGEAGAACKALGFGQHAISSALANESFYRIEVTGDQSDIISKYQKALATSLWHLMTEKLGLGAIMDAKALKEWRETIQKDPPPCNLETLEGTFSQLRDNQQLIFNRGVVNAFQCLSNNYKTNDIFKIGDRIVMHSVCSWHCDAGDRLADVERIFYVLEGHPIPGYRGGVRGLISDHRSHKGGIPGVEETEYMSLRFFKNTNVHVTFKRSDLIERCNKIIATFYGDKVLP